MEKITEFVSYAWNYFITQVTSITFTDVVDILIVSVLFYYIIRFIRDRRAGKLAVGVMLLILCQGLASVFDLTTLKFIMENVFQVGILAIIIVFQPELRSMLENVGGDSLRSLRSIGERSNPENEKMIGQLCEALCDMSLSKTGALVAIERSTKLGDVIKSGTVVNADVSSFLLKNIFFNKAPLHDGAVIIRDGRIYAAGCLLPLSTNLDIIKDLGTRHRAAIGMSENSDAAVLVVSEETGTISFALGGQLKRNYNYASLRAELENLLIKTQTGIKQRAAFSSKTGAKSDEKKPGGDTGNGPDKN